MRKMMTPRARTKKPERKNDMDARLLCIADPNGRVACFLKAGVEGLVYVSGTPEAERKIGAVLIDLVSRGVHARAESLTSSRIGVDFVPIGSDDPRYLDRCAAEFRARGWSACVYPRRLAAVWRKLQVLPVDPGERASVAEGLDRVTPQALEELERALDVTERELRAAAG